MIKIKTRRSAAKRFRATSTGKLMSYRAGKSHLLTHKSRKRKRNLKKEIALSDGMVSTYRRMMPYL
ncbi:MAG: 50S ribosomal protein L35 [Dissulfurimicrobium sp.]|uniref:50S ribosomal protein L35 n=1 Tax=Dissulfurimicrobium TaxID=1769732 RepID=UPI001EDAB823|nr:50S ribosomal protein L35 [Dissulfurimicrobium hydrothermale]UKL13789.1 50S ribosomal protein L35 [Dissulfurimicrobium hydrothermale]